MNKVLDFLKEHKYLMIALVLVGISITLGATYSNYIVTSNNHKAAEMYIGTLKYSMTIDGTTTNTLSVPSGETIVDVTITNENPIDTYYKLIYQNNSNISIKYYESTKDTNDNVTNYSSPNDKITSSGKNTIKLKITNSSTSSQTITFKIVGGFATNTLNDVTVPAGYTIIEKDTSTNTYFCTTTDTLTQGLKYVNGQYTYGYKQRGYVIQNGPFVLAWTNMDTDGWGVMLTNRASTDVVNSKVCTYINNKPISSMSYMFFRSLATILDLSSFNTSKVTNMNSMFNNSEATTLDVSNFDTSKVTDMNNMFSSSQATTLDVSNFNTSNVTDMESMFSGSQATTLDVSNFNTSNVTNMRYMFGDSQATTLDVSNFDTSKVIDMSNMFSDSQATTLDLSNFDTSKVRYMEFMFDSSKATILDLSSFNTSKVTNMRAMFSSSQATTLDLSNFDTSNVTNMSYMFNTSTNLKTIYVGDKFNTNNVTSSANMFTDSTKLVGGAGTKYDSTKIDKAYAHIDGGTSNPGYFTDIADKDIPVPNSFATDSWKTIIKAVRNNNISKYNVGDTKTVDLGTYGTHTLRIANTSTPSECSGTGFSQTACGFVLEFADIITTHNMNPSGTYKGTQYDYGWNKDGWPASSLYTFVNNDIYNAIPSEIKNAIIDTTVVSGHGSEDTANFTSTDKLYLLSTAEVWAQGSSNTISYDTARDNTRQLDYYKNLGTSTSNYSGAIKKNGTSADYWWLRAASSDNPGIFFSVNDYGDWINTYAKYTRGVAPAFRLG
jgi:surface protein